MPKLLFKKNWQNNTHNFYIGYLSVIAHNMKIINQYQAEFFVIDYFQLLF